MTSRLAAAAIFLIACEGSPGSPGPHATKLWETKDQNAFVLAVLDDSVVIGNITHVTRVRMSGDVIWEQKIYGSSRLDGTPIDELTIDTHDLGVIRFDPETGAHLQTVGEPGEISLRHGTAIFEITEESIRRYDDFTLTWSVDAKGRARPFFTRDAVWKRCPVLDAVCGYALTDGHRIGHAAAPGYWGHGDPAGDTVITYDDTDLIATDATTLAERWRVPHRGTPRSLVVDADRLAAVTGGVLMVLNVADGAVVWSHEESAPDTIQKITLEGDLLAYFDESDAGIHLVRLPGGAAMRLMTVRGGTARIPEGRFEVGPRLDEPPIISGPYVIIPSFTTTVWRLDRL